MKSRGGIGHLSSVVGLQELGSWSLLHAPAMLIVAGVSEAQVGLVWGVGSALSIVSKPAIGRLLDERSLRAVWGMLIAGSGLCLVAFAIAEPRSGMSWISLVGARLFVALAFPVGWVAIKRYITPPRQADAFMWMGAVTMAALILAGSFGTQIDQRLGATALFGLGGLIMVFALGGVIRLPKGAGTGNDVIQGRAIRTSVLRFVTQGSLQPVWLSVIAGNIAAICVFTFGRTFASASTGGNPEMFFVVFGLGALGTRLLFASTVRVRRLEAWATASVALYAVGLALAAAAGNAWMFSTGTLVAAVGHGICLPIQTTLVTRSVDVTSVGAAVTSLALVIDVSSLIGSPIVGSLVTHFGYGVGFRIVAVGALAIALLAGLVMSRRRLQ